MFSSVYSSKKVLLVEDTFALAAVYQQYLRALGLDVTTVSDGKSCLASIEQVTPEVVVLDLGLPDMEGIELLKEIQNRETKIAVVVITSNASLGAAVEAMRLGAFDYVVKPFNAERLNATIRNAIAQVQLSRKNTNPVPLVRPSFQGFIGNSMAMLEVYRVIESAARSTATVFITGESGTGKEICANALHDMSNRAKGQFVALNCAAIPRELMESEIFGHVRGAFTGAVSDRIGAAQLSNGGTLFLDEVCELDLDLQTKLLRLLQNGTVQRIGSGKIERVDLRVVCATNRDPKIEVKSGRFREDLFYRLHVIPVHLPPLRDRDVDKAQLAEFFLKKYAHEESKAFVSFSPDAQYKLLNYSWPGNIREMQNAIRNAVVLNSGTCIESWMLPIAEESKVEITTALEVSASQISYENTAELKGRIKPFWQVERDAILNAIDHCGGNMTRAAALLEVGVSTLYRKKQEYGLGMQETA